jgi:hypothetical protein
MIMVPGSWLLAPGSWLPDIDFLDLIGDALPKGFSPLEFCTCTSQDLLWYCVAFAQSIEKVGIKWVFFFSLDNGLCGPQLGSKNPSDRLYIPTEMFSTGGITQLRNGAVMEMLSPMRFQDSFEPLLCFMSPLVCWLCRVHGISA